MSGSSRVSDGSVQVSIGSVGISTATTIFNDTNPSLTPPTPTTTRETTGIETSQAANPNATVRAGGVSAGATGGIAVACAILGIAIGAFVTFLLLRRRQRQQTQPSYTPMKYGMVENNGAVSSIPATKDSFSLDHYLLDSKPDTAIAGELQSISALIQQHVENNYHVRPVAQSSKILARELLHLGLPQDGPLSRDRLAALSLDPRTRYAALRHILSRVILSSTAFGSYPFSLLPGFVSAFREDMPPLEHNGGNPEGRLTMVVIMALTKWRQLSAFLLNPDRGERTPLAPSEEVSTQQAHKLAVNLNKFLEPFNTATDRESRYEQENHLREVIVEFATFGYLLFSQPSEFLIHFDEDGKQGGIAVSPGLYKVSDEKGRRYSTPQMLVAPEIEIV